MTQLVRSPRHMSLSRCRCLRGAGISTELAPSTKDRADYLDLRANAQFSVPEDQLVDSVRKVLARHGAAREH